MLSVEQRLPAARYVLRHRQGKLPRSYDELLQIPSIGPYTAAAVASMAFGKPHAVVDGNVMRVEHGYSHFTVTLHVYHCHHIAGEPQPIQCQAWRWARPRDLRRYAFPGANRRIIDALLSEVTLKR